MLVFVTPFSGFPHSTLKFVSATSLGHGPNICDQKIFQLQTASAAANGSQDVRSFGPKMQLGGNQRCKISEWFQGCFSSKDSFNVVRSCPTAQCFFDGEQGHCKSWYRLVPAGPSEYDDMFCPNVIYFRKNASRSCRFQWRRFRWRFCSWLRVPVRLMRFSTSPLQTNSLMVPLAE